MKDTLPNSEKNCHRKQEIESKSPGFTLSSLPFISTLALE